MLLWHDWVCRSVAHSAGIPVLWGERCGVNVLCVCPCTCGAPVPCGCVPACLGLLLLNIYGLVDCNWERPGFNWLGINKHVAEN